MCLRCRTCGYTRPVFEGWEHTAGSECSGVEAEGLSEMAALLHTWELVADVGVQSLHKEDNVRHRNRDPSDRGADSSL